ncbi:hypothetical protein BpHYR1_022282 [Brachionus plicatilis]|uniref:Uncharacterized protein n=1 Tax=Brachionus plicatilis TaxID=10195 RepID=A0A3M7PI95_BRAPC|nr:hypothetical protein BpHYR1_022282 [Brachionus plicatilis]
MKRNEFSNLFESNFENEFIPASMFHQKKSEPLKTKKFIICSKHLNNTAPYIFEEKLLSRFRKKANHNYNQADHYHRQNDKPSKEKMKKLEKLISDEKNKIKKIKEDKLKKN